ncbi:MAG: response regulator [Desulfobulbaceae bacterium]|jgi:response regulator RpfG family c-di-GMP phosphodiesterase|nr:response regulator [Desulfobulbaceae bacterium]
MFSPILFIDDDINLLKSFKRTLSSEFKVVTADTPEEGLRIMAQEGPFSIIVSDMKMPGMNGVEVLSRAQKINPDTVRILLTGYADQQSAIDAVNIGNIFRFLTKPCDLDTLVSVLRAGIRQYQLIISEKELLEHTLLGIVNVLSQILTLVNPVAQSKTNRLKKYCRYIGKEIHFKEKWLLEMAALLSQIGCLTIPPEVLARYGSGGILKEEELKMLKEHPVLAGKLLMHIPRFENIIEIIALQDTPISKFPRYANPERQHNIHLCARILQIANGLDKFIMAGVLPADALDLMRDDQDFYDPELLKHFKTYDFGLQNMIRTYIHCKDLNNQMIIDEDIYTTKGLLVVTKGQSVTFPLLSGLLNFSHSVGIKEPFAVLTPLLSI